MVNGLMSSQISAHTNRQALLDTTTGARDIPAHSGQKAALNTMLFAWPTSVRGAAGEDVLRSYLE